MAIGIGTILGIASSLFGASQANAAGERAHELMMAGGKLSKEASYANAADAERLGGINATAIRSAAATNAEMYSEIGYANANAIARATQHNLGMYQIQADESQKQHIRGEKWHAGEIRAMASGSGIAINSGSPLAYLQSEITKGVEERFYMGRRDALTMIGMGEEGLSRSLLTVKSANMNANVTISNAALKANVAMSEAIAQAAAMRRQGDIAEQVGVANAQAARAQGGAAALSAVGDAVSSGVSAYASWKSSQVTSSNYSGITAGNYKSPASWNTWAPTSTAASWT